MKPVKEYEGRYSVTKEGKVWSHLTKRWLKPGINSLGYCNVVLVKDGLRKNMKVHRIVATTYIKNSKNHPIINHKDGNKLNNNISNLEWCTSLHNNLHTINILGKHTRGIKNSHAKLNEEKVAYIRENPLRLYYRELANMFGVTRSSIEKISRYVSWKNPTS